MEYNRGESPPLAETEASIDRELLLETDGPLKSTVWWLENCRLFHCADRASSSLSSASARPSAWDAAMTVEPEGSRALTVTAECRPRYEWSSPRLEELSCSSRLFKFKRVSVEEGVLLEAELARLCAMAWLLRYNSSH
jgi:hypothetical protein